MLGNPVESAVLYFDRRRMLDGLLKRTHCATIDANRGSKKYAPIIFAEDELRHLLLDKANVSGSIPRSISNLQSLELLRLRHDQITGTFPDNIGQSVDGINCVKISVHPYFGSADSFERTQFAIVAKT